MFKKHIIVPFQLLSIDGDGFHLLIQVELNGQSAQLLVDTGASRTVFDRERMRTYIPDAEFLPAEKPSTGLGTDSMEGHLTRLDSFRIGSLELRDLEIVLLDLAHVNQSYGSIGLTAIDGVLGSDLMSGHEAVIDYGKKEIRLRKNQAENKD